MLRQFSLDGDTERALELVKQVTVQCLFPGNIFCLCTWNLLAGCIVIQLFHVPIQFQIRCLLF